MLMLDLGEGWSLPKLETQWVLVPLICALSAAVSFVLLLPSELATKGPSESHHRPANRLSGWTNRTLGYPFLHPSCLQPAGVPAKSRPQGSRRRSLGTSHRWTNLLATWIFFVIGIIVCAVESSSSTSLVAYNVGVVFAVVIVVLKNAPDYLLPL